MKYVKLPYVYFNCGKLTHESRSCKEHKENTTKLFGKWLKAEDQLWNIPEWLEMPAERMQFKMIAPAKMEGQTSVREESQSA